MKERGGGVVTTKKIETPRILHGYTKKKDKWRAIKKKKKKRKKGNKMTGEINKSPTAGSCVGASSLGVRTGN